MFTTTDPVGANEHKWVKSSLRQVSPKEEFLDLKHSGTPAPYGFVRLHPGNAPPVLFADEARRPFQYHIGITR